MKAILAITCLAVFSTSLIGTNFAMNAIQSSDTKPIKVKMKLDLKKHGSWNESNTLMQTAILSCSNLLPASVSHYAKAMGTGFGIEAKQALSKTNNHCQDSASTIHKEWEPYFQSNDGAQKDWNRLYVKIKSAFNSWGSYSTIALNGYNEIHFSQTPLIYKKRDELVEALALFELNYQVEIAAAQSDPIQTNTN